jgi:hypothetical protein
MDGLHLRVLLRGSLQLLYRLSPAQSHAEESGVLKVICRSIDRDWEKVGVVYGMTLHLFCGHEARIPIISAEDIGDAGASLWYRVSLTQRNAAAIKQSECKYCDVGKPRRRNPNRERDEA